MAKFNRFHVLLLIALILCSVVGLIIFRKYTSSKTPELVIRSTSTFEDDLKSSLILYANWFINNQTPYGSFNYELDVKTGALIAGNNEVRQAGSLYSVAQMYKLTKKLEYRAVIDKGIHYFEYYLESVPNDVPTTRIKFGDNRKSNAVALYLLALIEFMEADPDVKDRYMDKAKSLANYILHTQTPQGGFLQTLDPPVEDSYNNGEAFYALIRMYKVSNDSRYLDAAKKAAEYLQVKYRNEEFDFSAYPWLVEGFAHLYSVEKNSKYWDFMKFYTDFYFSWGGDSINGYLEKNIGRAPSANLGVYVEGLSHVAWIAKDVEPAYYERIMPFIERALKYLMSLQINGPRSERKSELPLISGGICFNPDCETQRIDITHHNLSAIYLYLTLAK